MTNEEFKKTLWDAANKLRSPVSAAEYEYPVLGLVFLKYFSDLFDAQASVIRKRLADPKSDIYIDEAEIRAEADNVFWVPAGSHFKELLKQAASPTGGLLG